MVYQLHLDICKNSSARLSTVKLLASPFVFESTDILHVFS